MKLRIRQRVFSWTDSYDVYDEWGQAKYFVKAEFFSFGHQLHVYDKDTGVEVGSVHQKLLALLPTFDIAVNGTIVGTVRRKFTLLRQDYQVDYRGWDVAGDFMGWDYQVYQGDRRVMAITKELLSWGDTYTLEVADPAEALPGLMLVIAIDAANCTHDD